MEIKDWRNGASDKVAVRSSIESVGTFFPTLFRQSWCSWFDCLHTLTLE